MEARKEVFAEQATIPRTPVQAEVRAEPVEIFLVNTTLSTEALTEQIQGELQNLVGAPMTPATLETARNEVDRVLSQQVAAGSALVYYPPPGQPPRVWTLTPDGISTVTLNTGYSTLDTGGSSVQYRWVYPNTTLADHQALPPGQIVSYVQGNTGTGDWVTLNNDQGTVSASGYIDYTSQLQFNTTTGGTTAITYAPNNNITTTSGTYTVTNSPYTFYANLDGSWSTEPETEKQKFKRKIRAQMSGPERKRVLLAPVGGPTPAELRARDTLRDMLSEADWRRYVTNSFIMVRGASSRWYQVFANHQAERIRVYEKGKHVANLCIHSDASCPLSDHVIAMKLQIEFDEESLWTEANRYQIGDEASTLSDRIGAAMAARPDFLRNITIDTQNIQVAIA